MIDILKKTLFTGIGLAVLTKERLVELGKDIAKHAELSESQAKEFEDELQQKAAEAKTQLETEIDRRVEVALERLKVARIDQLNALSARVAELEAKQGGSRS